MKQTFLLIVMLAGISTSFAQTARVKGSVRYAENNDPLPDATVSVAGIKKTTTNINGEFSVECSGDSLLLSISYIGYDTWQQKVACGSQLEIMLNATANNLNTVEITATSNPNKAMLYQPVSIAKLGETELKRGAGLLLDDAININIPGVFMERRSFSAGQQFNIRGYGNGTRGTNGINSNFDGQGYKVYLNGIPVTDAEGITLMDDIDFASIGNVEVVKGPSGTLYGQAIAGVVNLKTKKAEPGKTEFGQDALLGSYGLQRYTTHFALSKARSSLMANYGKQLYNGFMPHTNSTKDFVNLFGEFNPNDKQVISSYFGYSNSYDERNGEITKSEWEAMNYAGNPAYIKNNAHSNVMSFRTGVSHAYRFNSNVSNTTSVFGTGLISNVSSAGGWTDKSTINYGIRSTIDTRFSAGEGLTISGISGAELQMQNAQTMGYAMVADSFNLSGYNIIGPLRSNQYTVSKTASVFTEWTLGMPGELSVTVGLGWSGLGLTLHDRLFAASNNNPSNPNGTHKPSKYSNIFNKMFSPHLAVNKVISKQVSVYASFSNGYKAPVSSYFFVPLTGEVLTGLKPESGTQYELGSKGSLLHEKLSYQFAVFYTLYNNKMTTIAVPNAANTATSYVYVANGGKQKNAGLELSLRGKLYQSADFLRSVNAFANLAYSHFRYGTFRFQQLSSDKKSTVETDYSNKVVAGVPPVTFNAGFDLDTKAGLYFNMTWSHKAKMYYTSDNKNETNTFRLLNAKLGFQNMIGNHLGIDAFAGVNNITQNQNYAMVFLNQLPDAYLPAPAKANVFAGVNLKYIF
ncbi:MAG TPA: TonB-dependent receptor plug domain-containing protein [Chitinophagaceae bacterium]